MNKIDEKVKAIRETQAELDHRTEVENRAIQLIGECRFQEADDLLHSLDDSILKDEWDAIMQN